MKGINLSEQGHFVQVVPPQDITGGAVGDRFKMNNYGHVSIMVMIGSSASAPTSITVKECDAATAGTATAIAFDYYEETTDGGDTLSAKQTATTSGITSVTANDNTFYVIELDAQALSEGFNWVEVEVAAPAAVILCSVVAVLSGSRFANEQSATAIA